MEEANFEILGEAYLDPILKIRKFLWIGIYEDQVLADPLCRVSRGPELPIPGTELKYKEAITFEGKTVGAIAIEDDRATPLTPELKQAFQDAAQQLSSIFAWKSSPWPVRLEALARIWHTKNRYVGFDWVGLYRKENADPKSDFILSIYVGNPKVHSRLLTAPTLDGEFAAQLKLSEDPNAQLVMLQQEYEYQCHCIIWDSAQEIIGKLEVNSESHKTFSPGRAAAVEDCAKKLYEMRGLLRR